MRKFIYLLLFFAVFSVAGCASTGDLRALRSELDQKMEEKLAAIDADLGALKKNTAALDSHTKRASQHFGRYFRFEGNSPAIAWSSGNPEKRFYCQYKEG